MTFEPMFKGQSAEAVADLKGRLVFLGYLQPPVDYSFDDRTEAAVHHYQGGVGFEATGEVDEGLWAQLCSDTDAHGYRLDQALAGAYDQNAAPEHITEHADHTVNDVRTLLNLVAVEATALAGNHAAGVGEACRYFEAYAKDRLDKLPGKFGGSDYLKNLSRHFVGSGGIELTKMLAGELALMGVNAAGGFVLTSLWIGFSMSVERQVGNAAKNALSTKEDLEKAVPELTREVTSGVLAEYDNLKGNFKAAIEDLVTKLNSNYPLDDKDVAAIEPLLTAGPLGIDHFLEHTVGIPLARESVRDDLYGKLVEAFEEMVLGATEFAPTAMDGAAATLLAGVNPDRYGSPAAVEHERQDERHRRAHTAAEEATRHITDHHPSGSH